MNFARNVQTMPSPAKLPVANLPKLAQVNRMSIAPSVDGGEPMAIATTQCASLRTSALAERCCHCGERCTRGTVAEGGRTFCCLGCLTVFALLSENGLEQFYEIASAPGVRVGQATAQRQW